MKRGRLLAATVARPGRGAGDQGAWLLMNGREGGFSRGAFPYPSLCALVERWAVTVGAVGEDEHGAYVEIHRAEPTPTPEVLAAARQRVQAATLGTVEHEVAEAALYALLRVLMREQGGVA